MTKKQAENIITAINEILEEINTAKKGANKMKVYLIEKDEWKLFDIEKDSYELKRRHIIIGDYARIADSAKIGACAKITKTPLIFSKEYIFLHMGILPDDNGNYTVYKAVHQDGQSFFDSNFVYKCGMTWRDDSLAKDQSIECGVGCHFTTYNNAVIYGTNQHLPYIIIEAKVHIDDILAVHQKMRVKGFSITRIMNLNF